MPASIVICYPVVCFKWQFWQASWKAQICATNFFLLCSTISTELISKIVTRISLPVWTLFYTGLQNPSKPVRPLKHLDEVASTLYLQCQKKFWGRTIPFAYTFYIRMCFLHIFFIFAEEKWKAALLTLKDFFCSMIKPNTINFTSVDRNQVAARQYNAALKEITFIFMFRSMAKEISKDHVLENHYTMYLCLRAFAAWIRSDNTRDHN